LALVQRVIGAGMRKNASRVAIAEGCRIFPFSKVVLNAGKVEPRDGRCLPHVGYECCHRRHATARLAMRGAKQIPHEWQRNPFGTGITDRAADLAGRDIEPADQGFGAVPDIFDSRRSTCPGFMDRLLAARSRPDPGSSRRSNGLPPCSARAVPPGTPANVGAFSRRSRDRASVSASNG